MFRKVATVEVKKCFHLSGEDLQEFGDILAIFGGGKLQEEARHAVRVVFVLGLGVLPRHLLVPQRTSEALQHSHTTSATWIACTLPWIPVFSLILLDSSNFRHFGGFRLIPRNLAYGF